MFPILSSVSYVISSHFQPIVLCLTICSYVRMHELFRRMKCIIVQKLNYHFLEAILTSKLMRMDRIVLSFFQTLKCIGDQTTQFKERSLQSASLSLAIT